MANTITRERKMTDQIAPLRERPQTTKSVVKKVTTKIQKNGSVRTTEKVTEFKTNISFNNSYIAQ